MTELLQSVNLKTQIVNSMDAMQWLLMFLGWFAYWLKELNTLRRSKGFRWSLLRAYISLNIFEIVSSILALVIVPLLADEIPPTLIDLNGKIAVFIVGYSCTSILNGLISLRKQIAK